MRHGVWIVVAAALLPETGCKEKKVGAADASVDAVILASKKTTADAGGAPSASPQGVFPVDVLAVSSRVENDSEQPAFVGDDNLDTAWSSKTGDLEGAWVELRFGEHAGTIRGVAMTVGMTKKKGRQGTTDDDDSSPNAQPGGGDLFLQNPRIAEVSIALNDHVLVAKFSLDPESRDLQVVPLPDTPAIGVLRITVKKVKMGTKPAFREVSISEIKLLRDTRPLPIAPHGAYVGALDPQPRGLLGVVPEQPAPMRCLAFLPGASPRVYCALGYTAHLGPSRLNGGELVAIDETGAKTIASFSELPGRGFLYQLPYRAWLRAERELKSGKGKTLAAAGADVSNIPWEGSTVVGGAAFRQRETMREPKNAGDTFDLINGVLEVKWPGETAFVSIFGVSSNMAPTRRMTATVRPIEQLWLVERHMDHGSEGANAEGAEASLCDFAAKRCTPYAVPTPEAKDD